MKEKDEAENVKWLFDYWRRKLLQQDLFQNMSSSRIVNRDLQTIYH